jgi:hypothetical protein
MFWTDQAGYKWIVGEEPTNQVFNPSTGYWVESSVVHHAPSLDHAQRVLDDVEACIRADLYQAGLL